MLHANRVDVCGVTFAQSGVLSIHSRVTVTIDCEIHTDRVYEYVPISCVMFGIDTHFFICLIMNQNHVYHTYFVYSEFQ